MPYLTGNATEDKVWLCFPVPDDTAFIANVVGLFAVMLNDWAWEKQGSATVEQSAGYARYALDNYIRSPELSLIQDVRLNDDGELEKMVGGIWLAAGDHVVPDQAQADTLPAGQLATVQIVDDTFVFGIPRGDTGADGDDGQSVTSVSVSTIAAGLPATSSYNANTGALSLGIPQGQQGQSSGVGGIALSMADRYTADGKDGWCYAANKLALVATDNLQDVAEVFDASASFVQSVASQVFQTIFNIPTAGVADVVTEPVAEIAIEGVTNPAIDYVRQNIRDDEVVAATAEIFFCAIKEAVENDDIDNVGFYIAAQVATTYIYQLTITSPQFGLYNLIGLGSAFAAAAADGAVKSLASVAAGYYLMHDTLWNDLVGLDTALPTSIRAFIGSAEFFDSRDCVDFDCFGEWEQVFDFTIATDGWGQSTEPSQAGNVWTGGVGWEGRIGQSNPDRNFIQISFDATEVTFIEFEMTSMPSGSGWSSVAWICPNETSVICGALANPATSNVQTWQGSQQMTSVALGVETSQPPPQGNSGKLVRVTMRGTGENPFT